MLGAAQPGVDERLRRRVPVRGPREVLTDPPAAGLAQEAGGGDARAEARSRRATRGRSSGGRPCRASAGRRRGRAVRRGGAARGRARRALR